MAQLLPEGYCKTLQDCVDLVSKYKTIQSNSMQVLQTAFKIEETEKKDNLLEIVSDKYCRKIIESTTYKPKSAQEISVEAKIPISTVYRRIQTLHDNKLLQTSGMISEDGKKFFLYKSKVKGIQSRYENGTVEVELILNK